MQYNSDAVRFEVYIIVLALIYVFFVNKFTSNISLMAGISSLFIQAYIPSSEDGTPAYLLFSSSLIYLRYCRLHSLRMSWLLQTRTASIENSLRYINEQTMQSYVISYKTY